MPQTIVIWFSSYLAPLKLLVRSLVSPYYTFQWIFFSLYLTMSFFHIWHFDSFLLLEILSSLVSETISLASKRILSFLFKFFNSFRVFFSNHSYILVFFLVFFFSVLCCLSSGSFSLTSLGIVNNSHCLNQHIFARNFHLYYHIFPPDTWQSYISTYPTATSNSTFVSLTATTIRLQTREGKELNCVYQYNTTQHLDCVYDCAHHIAWHIVTAQYKFWIINMSKIYLICMATFLKICHFFWKFQPQQMTVLSTYYSKTETWELAWIFLTPTPNNGNYTS